jgi:TetR/AcrR family transcriptional regulator, repressor of fatR-cypB operon
MESTVSVLSRRDRERENRRLAIVSAAREVFAEKGYVRATIDEIAHRAEFGKGTLYNYFPAGKEALLLAVFDELYDALCALIQDSFSHIEDSTFRKVMHDFIRRSFEFFSDQFDLFLILVKEAQRLVLSSDREKAKYFKSQQDRIVDTLSRPLREAMNRGILKQMSPELLAHLLFINIKGCQMRQCLNTPGSPAGRSCQSASEMATALTNFILDGAGISVTSNTENSDES